MNKNIDRLGTSTGWKRYWKQILEAHSQAVAAHDTKRNQDLVHYATNGYVVASTQSAVPDTTFVPVYQSWESTDLGAALAGYAQSREIELEICIEQGRVNHELASSVFAAEYLSQMIRLEIHRQFPNRFGGRVLSRLFIGDITYTALGIVLNFVSQSTRLARSQLAAYRRGYYADAHLYPIYIFILRVLSDYLESSDIEIAGEALDEPIFQKLFELWRTASAEGLEPVCLAALDFHTHRCKQGNLKNFYEFEQGNWTRIPIEIWLIFKLRKELSLKNPVLDHPMMEGACGIVPKDYEFKPDELLVAVYERMKRDGFDEEKIMTELING